MDPAALSYCVRQYVVELTRDRAFDEWANWLAQPGRVWAECSESLIKALLGIGIGISEISDYVREHPYLLLSDICGTDELPETPTGWLPIPESSGPLAALTTITLLAGVCGMEVVSYNSENDGALFVNLVALPGDGAIAEKSKAGMRGHTDAATFPFRGTTDPKYPRIAPSPDIVFLAALRNPEKIPTVVMPLPQILSQLSEQDIRLLKGPNMVLSAQKSFVQGTRRALGKPHLLDGAPILLDGPEGTWVRYTHSQSALFDEEDKAAEAAKGHFEAACLNVVQNVVLKPGDILLVNNRKALHGRAKVGDAVGGESRWLIRSYGLDCAELNREQRHESHKLYP